MLYRSAIPLALLGACLAGRAAAQAPADPQPKSKMNAREFFYSDAPEPKPAKPAPKTSPKGKNSPSPSARAGSSQHTQPGTGGVKAPDGTPVIAAVAGPPLGLKYTILKRIEGQAIQVPDNTVFHTGDKIQLQVETNGPGYLYIISQGSSGAWKPMFPAPEIGGGSNQVQANKPVTLPSAEFGMTFVEPAGAEKIMIVLSRRPVPDFEDLIYSLEDKSKPAAQPAEPKKSASYLVADASIGDPTVERFRTVYSRDLIIEKVDPTTPGERKETATYVVNPAGGDDSRLVADLHLVHQ